MWGSVPVCQMTILSSFKFLFNSPLQRISVLIYHWERIYTQTTNLKIASVTWNPKANSLAPCLGNWITPPKEVLPSFHFQLSSLLASAVCYLIMAWFPEALSILSFHWNWWIQATAEPDNISKGLRKGCLTFGNPTGKFQPRLLHFCRANFGSTEEVLE